MSTFNLNRSNFHDTLLANDLVFVEYWASWCGPCRLFGPVYEAAAGNNPDVVFGKVDTEAEPSLAAEAGVSSIPTLMAFRGGILVWGQPGGLPPKAFDLVIEGLRNLDMIHFRAASLSSEDGDPRIINDDRAVPHDQDGRVHQV